MKVKGGNSRLKQGLRKGYQQGWVGGMKMTTWQGKG